MPSMRVLRSLLYLSCLAGLLWPWGGGLCLVITIDESVACDYFAPRRVAEYCREYVRLSVWSHNSKTTRPNFRFFLRMLRQAVARPSHWRRCDTLWAFVFVDDVMFSHIGENVTAETTALLPTRFLAQQWRTASTLSWVVRLGWSLPSTFSLLVVQLIGSCDGFFCSFLCYFRRASWSSFSDLSCLTLSQPAVVGRPAESPVQYTVFSVLREPS